MEELIKINERKDGRPVVSARELYSKLTGSNRIHHINVWLNKKIERNEYAIENVDYQRVYTLGANGQKLKDYAITTDFAKELCMLSHCAKGKEIRKYFIDVEKKYQQLQQGAAPALPQSFAQALRMAAEQQELIEQQEKSLKIQAPKVEYVNKVLLTEDTFTTTQIAKELDMTARKLHALLAERRVMFKQSGEWMLYANYQNKGYTKTRTSIWHDSNELEHSSIITVWTQKGRAFIHKLLNTNLSYSLENN